MIDRLVEDQLPKPEPKIVEGNPARRALREKYEKMKIFELQRYLEADGADRYDNRPQIPYRSVSCHYRITALTQAAYTSQAPN